MTQQRQQEEREAYGYGYGYGDEGQDDMRPPSVQVDDNALAAVEAEAAAISVQTNDLDDLELPENRER